MESSPILTLMSSTDDNPVIKTEWLEEFPKELWILIAKRLTSAIDFFRFRSTCRTWRSSTTLPHPSSLSLFSPQILIPHNTLTLLQTKFYRLQPISSHNSSSNNNGWIIMVGDSRSNPLRLLDPFTSFPFSKTSRKVLNLLNFNFIELTQAYSLNHEIRRDDEEQREFGMFIRVPEVLKVVLFPSTTNNPCMVFALYKDGKLRVSKIGEVVSRVLIMGSDGGDNDGNSFFDDLTIHMGQVYVVDKLGTILWVDCSSLKLVQFSPMLCGYGTRKQLVVCGGSFYVVDLYIEGEPDNPMGMFWEVVGVRVYRLDEDWGKWVDVKDLGDSVFVLGKDTNFSVSAKDYNGCEGNCVYFYSANRACAFSLKTSNFINFPSNFWLCPSSFDPNFKWEGSKTDSSREGKEREEENEDWFSELDVENVM